MRGKETTWIANLGLLGKMVGAAAVLGSTLTMEESKKIVVETSLKALGVLGEFHPSWLVVCNYHNFIPADNLMQEFGYQHCHCIYPPLLSLSPFWAGLFPNTLSASQNPTHVC